MRYFVVLLVFFLAGCSGSTEVKSTSGEVPRASKPASAASVGLQQRLALVIGNQDYAVKPLHNPVNDARDIAAELENLGFQVMRQTNAEERAMRAAMNRFAEKLQRGGGLSLFYYSGHGLQYRNQNYLVPIDATINRGADVRDQAVNAQWVSDTLAEVNPDGVNIMILDACRNSPYKSITKDYGGGLAQMDSPRGSLIAYATAPNTVALGTGAERNSIFTKHLLAALRDPATRALSITDLFIEVGARVSANTNRQQVPWQSVALTSRVCLGVCVENTVTIAQNTEVTPNTQRESVAADSASGEHIRRYIAYPNGTTIDTETGLMWMRCILGQSWHNNTCVGAAKQYTYYDMEKITHSFAGYDDWRLPTIDELVTLVYCSNGKPDYFSLGEAAANGDWGCYGEPGKDHDIPTVASQKVFPNIPKNNFIWSANPSRLYGVNFDVGGKAVSSKPSNPFHVRLVRSTHADKLLIPSIKDESNRTLHGHTNWVISVAYSPDGKKALSGSFDTTVKEWDLKNSTSITMIGHGRAVYSAAYSPDGKSALSGGNDNNIREWDVDTGKERQTLNGHTDWVFTVAYSPDGKRALSGSKDNTMKEWDLTTGKELRTLTGHTNMVFSVAYSPDGKRALTGSNDNTVKEWDLVTGREIHTFIGHARSVKYSPDGKRALGGGYDGMLREWDLATERLRITLNHMDNVHTVTYSPDGKRALSGGYDNTIKEWDLSTGHLLRTFSGHQGPVYSVVYSPDGKRALSGSEDKTIKEWDLSS